jgi:hypothetical protein
LFGLVAYWLEGSDLAGLGRDIVDEDAALRLGAELVIELEAVDESTFPCSSST